MPDTTDPARVHEILAILMLAVLLLTMAVAFAYIRSLGAFFNEMKHKEPDVWQRVGAPSLVEMRLMPLLRFRRYYAFLPVLRERAARQDNGYRYAGRTYLLLRIGLAMTVGLFLLGGIIVFLTVRYDL